MTAVDSEALLVRSLYIRPGEDADLALGRIASLPPGLSADDIADAKLRREFEFIIDNAYKRELATTVRLAAVKLNLDEFDLASAVASVDPSGVGLYADSVIAESDKRKVRSAIRKARISAAEKPAEEALEAAYRSLAEVELSTENTRLLTVAQRAQYGEEWLVNRQQEIASGKPRIAFPVAALNEMIPYLLPGWMVLVTAESGQGKTSFTGQMADYNARRGLPVLTVHFEDTHEMMHVRQIIRQAYGRAAVRFGVNRLLGSVLTAKEIELARRIAADIAEWGGNSYEFYAGGLTMEAACHVWRQVAARLRFTGNPLSLVVIDYLNKASITPQKSRMFGGHFGARGYDAELVKRTAEATKVVAVLCQQEVNGVPYETRQGWQKSQVWLSLSVLDTGAEIRIRKANLGRTGLVQAEFDGEVLLWR